MKKMAENRYPNAATLFRFCKEALAMRYEGNVKVIDQDVGAILGYDPADCSHWKKGKKNIRGLHAYKSLAENLNVDERLLIDVATGRVDLNEAVFEYKGYGDFQLNGKTLDTLKKEYFKNPVKFQKLGSESKSFEELFEINRDKVIEIANQVVKIGQFSETPLYIPELFRLFSKVRLTENAGQQEAVKVTQVSNTEGDFTVISHKGDLDKPYVRYLLVKELYKFMVDSGSEFTQFMGALPAEVIEIQSNIFASHVLIPDEVLTVEVDKITSARDIISQLANVFWVSKSLMNQRLRDFMAKS